MEVRQKGRLEKDRIDHGTPEYFLIRTPSAPSPPSQSKRSLAERKFPILKLFFLMGNVERRYEGEEWTMVKGFRG